jgi:membrane-bound lytic murein transglycosylase D
MKFSNYFSLLPLAIASIFHSSSAFSQTLDTSPASSILSIPSTAVTANTELKFEQIDTSWHKEVPLNINESNLWDRIRKGYAIPNLENQLVNVQTNWYSSRVDYFNRTIQRSSRYLYHVVEQLERRGMPTDLALLPFIESAFNPQAISSAKASGLWQFMPATGRDFNLKQSIFKDDRRGILDSTDAALDYLQKLHSMFGDWQLALAAYNWGEGSVQRAIKKQEAKGLPIDFNSLSALMPTETKNYVPKLQAVKNIIGNPEFYDMSLPPINNEPYFTSIIKEKDIDVKLVAQFAELPLSEFKALNPQFNRPIITGSNSTTILLPLENADLFESNLAQWTGPLSSWTTYKVNKTEKIEALANRLGFQANILRDVNVVSPKMYIKAGSTLLIPRTTQTQQDNIPIHLVELGQLTQEKQFQKTRKISIKAGKKDSLASIAKRYKVDISDIKEWNKLTKEKINVGQKLTLMIAAKPKTSKQSTKKTRKKTSKKLSTKGKKSKA